MFVRIKVYFTLLLFKKILSTTNKVRNSVASLYFTCNPDGHPQSYQTSGMPSSPINIMIPINTMLYIEKV